MNPDRLYPDLSEFQEPSTSAAAQNVPPQAPPRQANLKERERSWIFGLIFYVRGLMRISLNNIEDTVCSKVAELVVEHKDLTGIERPVTTKTIKRVWTAFIEKGKIARDSKTAGRKKKSVREEIECMAKSTALSTRQISSQMSSSGVTVSQSTVRRVISKELKMRFYLRPQGQPLTPNDITRRFNFANEMRTRIAHKSIDINNILFTDECMIGTGSGSNRRNDGLWLARGELCLDDSLIERRFQGQKCHIWVGIHSQIGMLGPYLVSDIPQIDSSPANNMTGVKYLWLLENKIVPELKSKLGPRFDSCWYMHDGAPVHTTNANIAYLQREFNGRLISNKTEFIWPPYSPDLNPLDFWFWAYLRKIVNNSEPQTIEEVVLFVNLAASEISKAMIKRAINDFPIRLLALLHFGGRHFEPKLKEFKRQRKAWSSPCERCGEVHYCNCATCMSDCGRDDGDDSSISDYLELEDDSDISSIDSDF